MQLSALDFSHPEGGNPSKVRWWIPIILIGAILGIGSRLHIPTNSPGDQPIRLPAPPPIDPASIDTVLERDRIPAIDDPQFEPASLADKSLQPDERVIGLVINGDARAYPIPILSSHEIVNDIVGGEPVAITWCPLCYSALVYSRKIETEMEPLSFGVSGKLLYNTLILYDRQTDSLWSQLYGAAVVGPLTGTTLSFFPSTHTEWKSWLAQYPDSLVLSKQLTCAQFECGSYAVDPYESYYSSTKEGLVDYQIPRESGNLELKKQVLGLLIAGRARAYGYDVLKTHPVINDQIDGIAVLIWFDFSTKTAVAFQRQVDDRALTFKTDPIHPGFLIDLETNSRWDATTGTAVEGPLRNTHLDGLFSVTTFEFGWFAYFPESDNYIP